MSQSAAPAPQQPAVVPRQVAAVPRQRDAVLPQARGSGLPVDAATVRLNRAREPCAISTSFRSNEACDRAFGFLWPRNTHYQAGATPYLGRTFTGWIAPACGWPTHSITSSARDRKDSDCATKCVRALTSRLWPLSNEDPVYLPGGL